MRHGLIFLLVASACGGPGFSGADFPADAVVGYVDEARVVVDPDSELPVDTNGLLPEIARALSLAAQVWDVDGDTLDGWTIDVQKGWMACQTESGAAWTWGCTYPAERTIHVAEDLSGCRTSVLVHEMGHVTGVNDHADPRFAIAATLAEQVCADE